MKLKHKSHRVFDVEGEIIKAGNQPSPVGLEGFQKELNKIAGLDISGRPNLRVSWGQDPSNRMVVCGEWRMKFPFWRNLVRHERVNPITGLAEFWDELSETGTPRFFVEELHSNAELQRNDRWENARWLWNGLQKLDVLGPVPETGFYTTVFCIAYHDELCCKGRGSVKGEVCLGAYREPADVDLERVRAMKWRRDHASMDDLAPSDSLLEKRTKDATEERNSLWRKGVREAIDSYFKTHAHTFTSLSVKLQQHGKYQFLGGTSKSGLTEEARKMILRRRNVSSVSGS